MARGIKTGGGSRKGRPNRITKELKDMIREALDEAGGKAYLVQQAQDNPTAFLTLIGKILPKDVNANIEGNIDGKWTVEFVNPAKKSNDYKNAKNHGFL